MKRILLSLSLAAALAVPTLSLAAPAHLTAPGFCQSTRFDGQAYKTFVGAHAIDMNSFSLTERTRLEQNPETRELMRRAKASRWGNQIAAGQRNACSTVTYWN